jgi:hypothetical protein
MSRLGVLFLGLAAMTWLVGGNILVASHYRRLGKSPWSGFRPFAFPFKNFNAKEWAILAVLLVSAFTLGAIGLVADTI